MSAQNALFPLPSEPSTRSHRSLHKQIGVAFTNKSVSPYTYAISEKVLCWDGMGRAGPGQAGPGRAGPGRAGPGWAGLGWAELGCGGLS